MEDNYARLSEVTNEMFARGLRELAEHMELAEESADSYILLAVNSNGNGAVRRFESGRRHSGLG